MPRYSTRYSFGYGTTTVDVRDVKADLIEFLRAHVNGDRISISFTPDSDIGFEEYDDVEQEVYVTPVSLDTVVPGGGQTQYSGIDPSGAGGIADVVASLQVDCWAGDREADIYAGSGTHPDIVATELAQEVYRVLFGADESATGPPIPSDYEWTNAEPPTESNDVEQSPTKYRRLVIARMKYTQTP